MGSLADVQDARVGALEEANHTEGARDDFSRALDLLVAGVLEPLGVEYVAEDGPHVEVGVLEHLDHLFQRVLVTRRLNGPRGDLRLVCDEEVVEMAADEAGGRRLFENDVDDVLTVEVAGAAEEGLLAEVVVGFVVGELPGIAARREPGVAWPGWSSR